VLLHEAVDSSIVQINMWQRKKTIRVMLEHNYAMKYKREAGTEVFLSNKMRTGLVQITRFGNILRFPRAAGDSPCATALWCLTYAFPPTGQGMLL